MPTTLATKPRWDKYDGYVGNFRANLAADVDLDPVTGDANKVVGVGLDSNGAIVIGAGQTGIIGLMIVAVGVDIHGNLLDGGINNMAGDPQDVGKHGEITNFVLSDGSAAAAGTKIYAHADGTLDAVATAGTLVGHTVEASRLVVNVSG